MTNIGTIDFRSDTAGQQLVDSLHHSGFAVLKNHPLSLDLLNEISQSWLTFFKNDEKQSYLYDPLDRKNTQEGYFPPHAAEVAVGSEHKDLKEYFHVVESAPIPPTLKHSILAYRKLTFELGGKLLAWVQKYTPADTRKNFSKPLTEVLSPTASLLRVLHYPPLDQALENPRVENAVRAAPHEDINLLTILPASEQPGLQVMDTAGNWVSVATSTGALIINTGDMLQEASRGYYPSTTHRVVNPKNERANVSRISIPFFLTPHLDYVLSERYTAGSYLAERLNLLNRQTDD